MEGASFPRRRPRPVADAPVAPLADGTELAKAWLLALVADAPLHRAAAVPAQELARGGPAFCGALLASLSSDEALERFTDGQAHLPPAALAGRLSGARTPAAVTAAVEALRGAAWHLLLSELRDPPATLVGDLSDRLAHVCAVSARASLEHVPAEPPGRSGPLADVLAGAQPGAAQADAEAAEPEPEPEPELEPAPGAAAPEAEAAAAAQHGAAAAGPEPEPEPDVPSHPDASRDPEPEQDGSSEPRLSLVDQRPRRHPADEREHLEPPDGAHVVTPAGPEPAPEAPRPGRFTLPRDFDREVGSPSLPTPPPGSAPVPPPANGGTATVTRVARPQTWAGDAAAEPPWLAAIARRLERRAADGLPFAVLAVEVDDLDRLLASETGREVAFALEVAERGLTAELAPADLVVRERLGRWWVTSPDRDAAAARDLGRHVAAAIATAALGGAPLRASIGVATCPDDGEDADALASRADVGVFAARASGEPVG